MNKKWKLRIEELEKKSLNFDMEERFDIWLAEHYPKDDLDYISLTGKVPEEFCSVFLDRLIGQISYLQHMNKRRESLEK